MAEYLFTVSEVFDVKGRGVILVPGVLTDKFVVRLGDPIELRLPNGIKNSSSVAGIEFIDGPLLQRTAPLLLRDYTREEIPIGTEVWRP